MATTMTLTDRTGQSVTVETGRDSTRPASVNNPQANAVVGWNNRPPVDTTPPI